MGAVLDVGASDHLGKGQIYSVGFHLYLQVHLNPWNPSAGVVSRLWTTADGGVSSSQRWRVQPGSERPALHLQREASEWCCHSCCSSGEPEIGSNPTRGRAEASLSVCPSVLSASSSATLSPAPTISGPLQGPG